MLAHRDEAVPVLLGYVKDAIDSGLRGSFIYDAHSYAMYLLAEFRIHDAFPHLLKYLELARAQTDSLLEAVLTEDFSSILASVATVDDLPKLKSITENESLDTYHRAAALDALRVLYTEDELERDEYVSYLHYLLDTLHGDPGLLSFVVWDCVDAGFREFQPKIKKLYRANLIDKQTISFDEVKDDLRDADEATAKRELKSNRHNLFITDTVDSVSWWSIFSENQDNEQRRLPENLVASSERNDTKSSLDDMVRFIRESATPVAKTQIMSATDMIKSFKSETQARLAREDIEFCNQIVSESMSALRAAAAVLDYTNKERNTNVPDMSGAQFKGAFMMNYVTVSIGLLLSYSPPGDTPMEVPDAFFAPPILDFGAAIIVIPHHSIAIIISRVADKAWYGQKRENSGALINVSVFKRRQHWQFLCGGHFIDAHYPRFSMTCAAITECPAYQESALKYSVASSISSISSTECKMGPSRCKICPCEIEVSKAYGTGLSGFLAIASMCFDRWQKRPLRSGTKKTKSYPGNGVAYIANTPQWEHVSEGFREVQLREYPDFVKQMQAKGWSVENWSSPCEHERRGHVRTLKDGRKVYVRPSIVNKGGEKVVYRIGE